MWDRSAKKFENDILLVPCIIDVEKESIKAKENCYLKTENKLGNTNQEKEQIVLWNN